MRSLFFIARHGETVLNESGKYRGWSNGPDASLNEDGIKSAHDAGQFLKKLGQKFSRIICSPLDRAQLTAAIIAGYLDIKMLDIDERLRPLNVGDYAGLPKEDNPIQPFLDNPKKKFPNGENIEGFESRQHDFAEDLLTWIEQEKSADDSEVLVVAHVSNVMYWWNLQTGANSDEYLGETSDIVEPGGIALVSEHTTFPVFKANRNAESQKPASDTVNTHAIMGEPGTGYETGVNGPFRCSNCEYFRSSNKSCGQKDMLEKSKQPRTSDGRVEVDPDGCCEYVERIEEKR